MRRHLPLALVFALLTPLAAIAAVDELEEDHQLLMDFVTPHTQWAKPYALGTTRVLYFGWGRGTEAREIVELMQRFDIQADAVFWQQLCDSPDCGWHGGPAGIRRMLRLLEKPYDCYIFNGIEITKLPPEAQYKVLKPVTDGAGLVVMGFDDPRVLKPGRETKPLPAFLTSETVGDAFAVKSGRGIRLPRRPDIPYKVGWDTEYEYWQERLGRAVLWAAGKEPKCEVRIAPEATTVDRTGDPRPNVIISARIPDSVSVTHGYMLTATLRRWDGVTQELAKAQMTGGSSGGAPTVNAVIPVVPAGQYHIDASLQINGKVAGWATVPVTVTSDRNVASVALDRDWGEVGDKIAGTVKLAGPTAPNDSLRVRLVDANGRVLVQDDPKLTGDEAAFQFRSEPWMPMLLRVEGVLLRNGKEASSAYQYYRITHRNRGRWNFVVWDSPTGAPAPYMEKALADLGCSAHLQGGPPLLVWAAKGMAQVPYTTRLLDDHNAQGITQPFCWNDQAAVQKTVDDLARAYMPTRQHGCFVYSLGDEGVTRGSCLSPECLEAYQGYLKQEYGDIAALNAEWGTNFDSFALVTLSKPDDNNEQQALRDKNYPRWFDRQAFQCWNLVQYCGKYKEAFAAIDPEAKTGFEGTGTLADGDDFDLIVRNNTFWSPYPGAGDEIIRSIAPRDFPRANWMGYTRDADSLLSKFWRMVTRGMDGVWWWRWDSAPPFRGLLAPYGGPYAAVKDIAADTRRVREGLGTILIRSQMQEDGIALLYSHPSAYAAKMEAGPTYGTYEGAHVAWHDLIRGVGLQFGYVTDRQMRLGEFDPKRWKVLILPQAEAIGAQEARVIRDFAEQGGAVIADVRPGIYDGHCKPLATGALDDLFGVKQTGDKPSVAMDVVGPGVTLKKVQANPTVTLTDGKSLAKSGDIPVHIIRQVGKGTAILLNASMSSFPRLAASDTPDAVRAMAASLLASGDAKPHLDLVSAAGKPVKGCEITRWINGDLEIVSLFRENGQREGAIVKLPSPRHVYDLRAGKYLGEVTQFPVTIVPCRATFLVLSPRAIAAPQVSLVAVAKPGLAVVAKLLVPQAAGEHALRVRVLGPDGKPIEAFDQTVIVGKQGAECALPIAFNDPTGVWTVQARDIYSDRVGEAKLAVR